MSTPSHTSDDPQAAQARGFALYVGIDEAKAAEAGISLPALVDRLRRLVAELVPDAQTHATVAIAPAGAGGRDIDVVRAALHEPGLAKLRAEAEPVPRRRTGVVIDISRKRVALDGDTAPLTFTEFELLQFLVLREGRAVERQEIIDGVWGDAPADEVPNARTIDVHIRRLRAKLGDYEDIVRTVRGAGYRFDRHADVSIRLAATPSPDIF
jgi:DNA-binding response OmpR family regulator